MYGPRVCFGHINVHCVICFGHISVHRVICFQALAQGLVWAVHHPLWASSSWALMDRLQDDFPLLLQVAERIQVSSSVLPKPILSILQ